MDERQTAINQLYAAYCDAGDDDMNARLRVKDDANEILAAPMYTDTIDRVDLERYLRHGHPVTDAELDLAEEAYNAEE